MLENLFTQLKDKLITFFKERPTATFLGILVFLASLCGGTYLFGTGPIDAIERLFFPVRFVVTETATPLARIAIMINTKSISTRVKALRSWTVPRAKTSVFWDRNGSCVGTDNLIARYRPPCLVVRQGRRF